MLAYYTRMIRLLSALSLLTVFTIQAAPADDRRHTTRAVDDDLRNAIIRELFK